MLLFCIAENKTSCKDAIQYVEAYFSDAYISSLEVKDGVKEAAQKAIQEFNEAFSVDMPRGFLKKTYSQNYRQIRRAGWCGDIDYKNQVYCL